MLLHDRAVNRGVELGPYPLEALARLDELPEIATGQDPKFTQLPNGESLLARAAAYYADLFAQCGAQNSALLGEVCDDLQVRAKELKGAAYYLDAAHAGGCTAQGLPLGHTHVLVLLIAHGRQPEDANLANGWLTDAVHDIAHMRALEIGRSIAGHIKALGFSSDLHWPGASSIDLERCALASGVAIRTDAGTASPFIARDFAIAAISTDYAFATDKPLATGKVNSLRYWWGMNGAISGREHNRQTKRASHLSRYPMEQVKRVERPTTLIFDDEIPRVPKRAEFFQRARMGDLGQKAQNEVKRFAFKHPLTDGMMHPLRAMVPHQDGEVAAHPSPGFNDASANTDAIKSLSYHLGADLTGICEIPRYAWYSHDGTGKPLETYHKYAVVMLIDQGYDTMEGASGDDWISGCQSMRGYIRGAEIAGVMAEFLRSNGVSARPQTNADSHVLQIPLVLLAGLGELSRIGELVLNPYVGPRFKSVVLTTNLPLVPDKPIDFGLQEFCQNCLKCARECPVNAIPFGDKVMFNGYEIWKPDVERCTRYRVTNPKGSACGRCMKTCPLNKVVTADGALVHRVGTWLGVNARWLKKLMVPVAVYLDDKIGYGRRNPVKRWWSDLELVEGKAVAPKATNERDIDVHADVAGNKSPVGYYHASDMPPPHSTEPFLANHKQAIARAEMVETVEEAVARRASGGQTPKHYLPLTDIT